LIGLIFAAMGDTRSRAISCNEAQKTFLSEFPLPRVSPAGTNERNMKIIEKTTPPPRSPVVPVLRLDRRGKKVFHQNMTFQPFTSYETHQ
jgi:hypothetical protein